MKLKLALYSVILILLFSCTPSFDLSGMWGENQPPLNETYFSPPSWIQGIWAEDKDGYEGFKFTQDNFYASFDYTSNYGLNWNQRINNENRYLNFINCTEQISSSEYHIKIIYTKITKTIDYHFTKVSENKISCHYELNEDGEVTIEAYSLIKH